MKSLDMWRIFRNFAGLFLIFMWKIYHQSIPECISALTQSPAMLRLQDVGMHCGCEYTAFPMFEGQRKYSRFDHSVGCALIVWHYTEDVRQAVAALLHDIATPTFAHVIDFLNGDHLRQESTEVGTKEIIEQDDQIMAQLKDYQIGVDEVADYHQYPIADNDSPRLSADRLEYTLSNIINYHIGDEASVRGWYENLVVGRNEEDETELMFSDLRAVEGFALASLKTSYIYIADEDRFAMQTLAELLKRHIARGVLSRQDLYLTEQSVIGKLATDREAWEDWNRYRALHLIWRNSDNPQAKIIHSKRRYIDPYVQGQGRVSALSAEYAEQLKWFLEMDLEEPIWGE